MLTHEDAISNIGLAKASKDLAEASKKDSSAMKTIAVMTMAFLPATFFAALFSVPSLKWDSPKIIQGTFWIYWAFTLPATLLVFLAWFIITNRQLLARKYFARQISGQNNSSVNEMDYRPHLVSPQTKYRYRTDADLPRYRSRTPGSKPKRRMGSFHHPPTQSPPSGSELAAMGAQYVTEGHGPFPPLGSHPPHGSDPAVAGALRGNE
jgi:hypothetical protein